MSKKKKIVLSVVKVVLLISFVISFGFVMYSGTKLKATDVVQGVVISGQRVRYEYKGEMKEVPISDVGIPDSAKIGDNYGLYFNNDVLKGTYIRSTQDSLTFTLRLSTVIWLVSVCSIGSIIGCEVINNRRR